MKVNFSFFDSTNDVDELQDYIDTIYCDIILTKFNQLDITYDNKLKLLEQIKKNILKDIE